jgi:TRAP-type C4-dicarboxylate transport system substrate-binding protein
MSESYIQLEKGILDGLFAPMEAVGGFHLAEVVKNHTDLHMWIGWQPNKVMNKDSWNNKLPADIQKIFLDSRQYWEDVLVKGTFEMDDKGFADCKKMGNEFIQFSPTEIKELYRIMDESYAEEAKKLDAKGIPGTAIFKDVRQAIEQAM